MDSFKASTNGGNTKPMNRHDDALEITAPTPQDYGFPEEPFPYQVEVWNRQELFLAAYARVGRRSIAAKEAGITIWCVDKWIGADVYSIRKRMQQAHQAYVESLEQLMDDRLTNPQGNRGSDVLLMFKLKAEAPEKYREEVKVVGIEASKQMMDRLREMAMKDREALEEAAPVVEGEYQEMPPVLPAPPVTKPPVTRMEPNPPQSGGKQKPGRYRQRQEKAKGRITRR
jgi:hypothetical protein